MALVGPPAGVYTRSVLEEKVSGLSAWEVFSATAVTLSWKGEDSRPDTEMSEMFCGIW